MKPIIILSVLFWIFSHQYTFTNNLKQTVNKFGVYSSADFVENNKVWDNRKIPKEDFQLLYLNPNLPYKYNQSLANLCFYGIVLLFLNLWLKDFTKYYTIP